MTDSFPDFYYEGGIIRLFLLAEEDHNVFATHPGLVKWGVLAIYFHQALGIKCVV